MTTNKKIFIVDCDNSEIQESTMCDYIEEFGEQAHDSAYASTIKIIQNENSFFVKEFKNGSSNGKNVIDSGIAYDTEEEAEEALDLFYKDYASSNENAPIYYDTEKEAKEDLAEYLG